MADVERIAHDVDRARRSGEIECRAAAVHHQCMMRLDEHHAVGRIRYLLVNFVADRRNLVLVLRTPGWSPSSCVYNALLISQVENRFMSLIRCAASSPAWMLMRLCRNALAHVLPDFGKDAIQTIPALAGAACSAASPNFA